MNLEYAFINVSDKTNLNLILTFLVEHTVNICVGDLSYKYVKSKHIPFTHFLDISNPTDINIDLIITDTPNIDSTVSTPDIDVSKVVSTIDINNINMLRLAAKQYDTTITLIHPSDYEEFMVRYNTNRIDDSYRIKCAQRIFGATSKYDSLISQYLFQQLI